MTGGRWYVVWILAVLYVVSYADRLILALLVEPLKEDLALSDTQIGLLIGPAFAFLYAVLGLPVAWLADRYSRKMIVVAGVFVWSASTVASSGADSFYELFLLRMGLALGEAVLSPVAVSLIADLFKRTHRSTPTAVFVASGTFGLVTAYILGGFLIALLGAGHFQAVPYIGSLPIWRATLVLIGAPGLLLALLILLTVREPRRGQSEEDTPLLSGTTPVGSFVSIAEAARFYVAFLIGTSICMTLTFAAVTWYPTYLVRAFGLSITQAGYFFGAALLVGALFALIIPAAANRIARGPRKEALLLLDLCMVPVGFLLFAASLLQQDLTPTLILMIVGFGILAGTNAMPTIAIALTAPPSFRARLVAINLAISNLLGLSLGPYAVARLGETYFNGPRALGSGMLLVGCLAIPLSCLLIMASVKPYRTAMRRVSESTSAAQH